MLLQRDTDEIDVAEEKPTETPAEAGAMNTAGQPEDAMPEKLQNQYRSGVGKLLHMMRWSSGTT